MVTQDINITEVRARSLKKADTIRCPRDGRFEKVTFNRPYADGRRFIRTSRHDHFLPEGTRVRKQIAVKETYRLGAKRGPEGIALFYCEPHSRWEWSCVPCGVANKRSAKECWNCMTPRKEAAQPI